MATADPPPKSEQRFVLSHDISWDSRLVDREWGWTQSAVMSNGDVVLWGKSSEESPAIFHVYSLNGDKVKSLKGLCKHEEDIQILPLRIQNKEYLAVSCRECHKIRLLNRDTEEVTEAFHDSRFNIGVEMTKGSEGTLYTVHKEEGRHTLLVLDCCAPHFQLKRTVETHMGYMCTVQSIPTEDIIIITDNHIIRAISAVTGDITWEISGEVDHASIAPYGIAYFEKHDLVLVIDGNNKRFLVLHPRTGEVMQTVDIGVYLNKTRTPYLHGNKLILHHTSEGKRKISMFKILGVQKDKPSAVATGGASAMKGSTSGIRSDDKTVSQTVGQAASLTTTERREGSRSTERTETDPIRLTDQHLLFLSQRITSENVRLRLGLALGLESHEIESTKTDNKTTAAYDMLQVWYMSMEDEITAGKELVEALTKAKLTMLKNKLKDV